MLRKRLYIFGFVLFLLTGFSATPASASITPTELTATLAPGMSIVEEKNVQCGEPPEGPSLILVGLVGINLTLLVDPVEYENWVSVDPPYYWPVLPYETRDFTVTITVPPDTPCDTYEFEIWANVIMIYDDGRTESWDFGRQQVIITVPCPGPLFSDAVVILPVIILFAVLIIRRRRPNVK